MSLKNEIKQFAIGFFDPGLFGSYVLTTVVSGTVFATCYFGYGCWCRVGGLLFLIFIPAVFILFLAVILAGCLQVWIWKRLTKQPDVLFGQMRMSELFWRACLAMVIIPLLCGFVGGRLREESIRKAFVDCGPLITSLEKEKGLHGIYPADASFLVKSDAILLHRYIFYYGDQNTNGVDWIPDKVAEAGISLFTATNRYQIVIPIEKMSPVSFSSFYVFSYTSEHPTWTKTLLHWSCAGAYIDEPN